MGVVNDFESNDVIGFSEFQQWIKTRMKITERVEIKTSETKKHLNIGAHLMGRLVPNNLSDVKAITYENNAFATEGSS